MPPCPDKQYPEPSLEDKKRFLLCPETYPGRVPYLTHVETHMSLVFLAGNRAYKLKKPIKLPFLDFSTIEKREKMFREELALNRRMAPDLYLEVVSINQTDGDLKLGTGDHVVDWLVVMRRLDERLMLDSAIANHRKEARQLLPLVQALTRFYRHAHPVFVAPARYLAKWQRALHSNSPALLRPELRMPVEIVLELDRLQDVFLIVLAIYC